MKKISLMLLLLLPLLLFCSCEKTVNESFDAFSGAFMCEYSYTEGDKLYRVKLVAGENDADGARSVTLCFIEPATLNGIECKSEAGEYRAQYGEVLISGESAKALFLSAEPLLSGGKAEFCGISEIDGTRAERFKISHGGGDIFVYVDGNTELPIAIVSSLSGREIKLNVISFERKEK